MVQKVLISEHFTSRTDGSCVVRPETRKRDVDAFVAECNKR